MFCWIDNTEQHVCTLLTHFAADHTPKKRSISAINVIMPRPMPPLSVNTWWHTLVSALPLSVVIRSSRLSSKYVKWYSNYHAFWIKKRINRSYSKWSFDYSLRRGNQHLAVLFVAPCAVIFPAVDKMAIGNHQAGSNSLGLVSFQVIPFFHFITQ